MHRTTLSALLLTLSTLGGCASAPAPALSSLTASTAPSAATSLKTAALTHVSGNQRGDVPPPAYLSGTLLYNTPPDQIAPLLFNLQDQTALTQALHANLVRLQVFKTVALSSAPAASTDLKITLVFSSTDYQPGHQRYTLDVTMQIQGGRTRFRKDYHAVSSPASSVISGLSTSPEQAKATAAKALLEQLLPDLQAFALEQA